MTFAADFTSQEFFRNPAAEVEKLRAAGPVVEVRFPLVGKVWTTTTQDLANQVLRDSKTFTLRKDDGNVAGLRWWMPGVVRTIADNVLTTDEPDHARLRGIVDEVFRRRAVLEMQPRIMVVANELANTLFADGSPADLVDRYARRLPLFVICDLLGLPLADQPKFAAWAGTFTRFNSALGFLAAIPTLFTMKRDMQERLDAAHKDGGAGVIAELVRIEKEGGAISRDEMVSMLFLLLFAGHETTTHLISGSVRELLLDPERRDWLEQDWTRAEPAVEEFLRFVSAVQFTKPRFVRKDVELGGIRLRKGEKIMPMLVAANFDPQANDHPDKLDLERRPNRHVAFGAGIHFCLGHQLARIEGKCALQALFERWPKLSLATDDSNLRWRTRTGIRALGQLPVTAGS
jgi:cytochrome P450